VFRLLGPAPVGLLAVSLAVTVQADGLLDLGGAQNWNESPDHWPSLVVSNGVVRLGGSSLYVRNGRTLVLRGGARIEGAGASAVRWYDGATNQVDGLGTGVVVAADGELVAITSGAASRAGVVFDVAGPTGCVAALTLAGHLGAGGSASHLIKRGAGTMALRDLAHAVRTNRLEAGCLLVNGLSRCGSSSAGAQWLVLPNATLGGTGIISNAPVVVQGGTLQPGDGGGGALTIASNVVLGVGATLRFAITRTGTAAGATNNQLVVRQGNLQGLSNANLRVELLEGVNADEQRFRLITGGGNLIGAPVGAVVTTGRTGREAEVITGQDFVDVFIHNRKAGTVVMLK
jgi:hypothetical protein